MLTEMQKRVIDAINEGNNRPTLIDRETARDTLNKVRGHTFITVVTVTEPDMRKTDNPFYGRVKKVLKMRGSVCFNYNNSVGNQRDREGLEREAWSKGTGWSRPITRPDGTLTPFCEHKEKGGLYLWFKQDATLSSDLYLDGEKIESEKLAPWLTVKKPNTNQGVDKPVEPRAVTWENVQAVSVNGETLAIL
jgi:hypothetical protein